MRKEVKKGAIKEAEQREMESRGQKKVGMEGTLGRR